MEEWPVPEPLPRIEKSGMHICPIVGLPLRENADVHALRRYWFKFDSRIWYMKQFRRRALYGLLKRKWNDWQEFLRMDSTPTFYREISNLRKKNDGAIIGIAGPKGCGKSILGQMIIERAVSTIPHVLFQYKDLASHVRGRDVSESLGIQIDEDLTATGELSRNLVVHVNNAFETSRKADLWASCSGVNLNFKDWGETLDLRIIPFGYSTRFQTTRFAVMSKDTDFLGMCALQRKHSPDDVVQYYDDVGFWGEYKARAVAFSNEVLKKGGTLDAIDDKEQDKHIVEMVLFLEENYIDKDKKIPSDLMCRRLYRKAGIPSKSTGYMKEIIAWAKSELGDEEEINTGRGKRKTGVFSDAWGELRLFIEDWLIRSGVTKQAYAVAAARYVVKADGDEDLSQDEIAEDIKREFSLGEKVKSIARNIRILRKRIQRPDVELTDYTERWLASQLETLGAKKIGRPGRPDIVLTGLHDREVAVKFSVAVDPWIEYPISPERNGIVVLILPRTRQFYLHTITGLSLALDNTRVKNGGGLVGIDGLVDAVKEMIEK